MKNMTRIHAQSDAGSRRSRNIVTMASTMLRKMITVITRVTRPNASISITSSGAMARS